MRAADNNLHEQMLNTEMIKSSTYRRTAIIVSIALVVILFSFGLTFFFFRRMRNAYRALVRRNQSWAGLYRDDDETDDLPDSDDEVSTNDNLTSGLIESITKADESLPDNIDRIVECIEEAMSEKKLFKQANLTLDMIAHEIDFNRNYVSLALNRRMNKSLNTYINELRVKEAIRLLSDPACADMRFETISFESGFSDRSGLYRAFIKVTGLSPSNFRKNIRVKTRN